MGMNDGAIVKWYKEVGDHVIAGEPLCEIEAAKVTVDMEVPFDGTLERLLVPLDEPVPVGTPIALIRSQRDAAIVAEPAAGQEVSTQPVVHLNAQKPQTGSSIEIEPRARREAKLRNIDLASVRGTGPKRRITVEDVIAFSGREQQHRSSHYSELAHSGMRRTLAHRLTQSKTEIPHFYLRTSCNVDLLLALRSQRKADDPETPISINDFMLRAVALALRDVPEANVSWHEKCVRRYEVVDVAMPVAVPGGVLAPVLRDVDCLSLKEISAESRRLAKCARAGQLAATDCQGGSISVSNLGMYGMEEFAAIIDPLQSAVLAIGGAIPKPIVIDDAIKIATILTATLSLDHRAIDGAVGAKLLNAFKRNIENPTILL